MKLYLTTISRWAWFRFAVSLVVPTVTACTSRSQTPTPSGSDSYQAWVGYNVGFYAAGANGGRIFTEESVHVGGSSWSSFWEEVEEMEVAEDAYYYSYNNYPKHDHSAYVNKITALCNGFIDNMHSKWKGSHDIGISPRLCGERNAISE